MAEALTAVSKVSGIVATWVTIGAATIGGYVGLSTYSRESSKNLDDRKKQTLELARVYASESYIRARRTLFTVNMTELACDPNKVITNENKVDFFTHVEFFDMVQICVEGDLCDKSTAEDFFSPYANWHWPILGVHVSKTRGLEASFKLKRPYGYGLEKLAISPILPFWTCAR